MRARAIERHPNGRCYLKYREGGKLHRIFLGTTDREVKRKLREVRASHEAGRILNDGKETSRVITPNGSDINLQELIVRHLAFVEVNKAEETFILRQRNLLYLLKFLGPRSVSSITADDLQCFADWIKSKHSRSGSPFHAIRECRALFNWANRMELTIFRMSRFPTCSEPKAEIKRFSTEDMTMLLSAAKGEFKDTMSFAAMSGSRPRELRSACHSEIEWNAIPCPLLWTTYDKTLNMKRTSNRRCIPLSKEAVDIIHRQRLRHPTSDVIFLNADGKPYTRTVLRNRLIRLCKKAGIPEKSPYALRHFFGTKSVQSRGLYPTSQLMGHSRVQTTMRYIAPNEPEHLEAMEEMGKMVGEMSRGIMPEGKVVAFEKHG